MQEGVEQWEGIMILENGCREDNTIASVKIIVYV